MNRIRLAAYVIFGLDILTFILWVCGGITIFTLSECRVIFFITHMLLLLHFGSQTLTIVAIIDQWSESQHTINTQEQDIETGKPSTKIKKRVSHEHRPIAWIVASVLTFFGDLYLLVSDVILYPTTIDSKEVISIYQIFTYLGSLDITI